MLNGALPLKSNQGYAARYQNKIIMINKILILAVCICSFCYANQKFLVLLIH